MTRKSAFSIHMAHWFLALAVLFISGCAPKPLLYPDVVPPEATAIKPLQPVQKPLIGLALGGGAARGFAHIGVIKALEKNGIRPDIVVGTSAGSFVGALYAGGYDSLSLEKLAIEIQEDEVRDLVLPDRGFIKGELLQDYVNQKLANKSIESLPIRYAAVATDLKTGAPAVFTRGNTGMAVRASSAIPGVIQPVIINSHEYIDGGLISPVPVRVARSMGAELVIAVDIAKRPEDRKDIVSTADVLYQSLSIMMKQLAKRELQESDVMIRPDTRDLVSIDFTTRLDAIQEGEEAAEEVISQILDWLTKRSEARKEKAVASIRPHIQHIGN